MKKRFRLLWRAIKFWWQRQTRGWDDSELWNLDLSLAKLILPRLRRFAEMTHGYPGDSSEEQWQADLRIMIATFEAIASDGYWALEADDRDALQFGLNLFAKHYRSLWD